MAQPTKSLNIRDPEAYRLARAMADRTGETLTHVVVLALQEHYERECRKNRHQHLIDEMKEISDRVKAMPVRDRRSADEIIGYNECGGFD